MNHDATALIHAYLDGELTDEQRRALGDWLRQSPHNVDHFVAECRLHSELFDAHCERWMSDAPPNQPGATGGPLSSVDNPPASAPLFPVIIEASSPLHVSRSMLSPVSSFLFSYAAAVVIVGIGLLIGWTYQVSILRPDHQETVKAVPPSPPTGLRPESELVVVGRVTGLVDCRWSDAKTGTVENAPVPLRRTYALASGLMKITYDTGAVVILEGPCTYTAESKTGGYLAIGRLTAKVEGRGRVGDRETGRQGDRELSASLIVGQSNLQASPSPSLPLSSSPSPMFAVRTPTATVTDLGTEFGVEVDNAGLTESHVYRGKVLLAAVGSDGQAADRAVTLGANESARIEKVAGREAFVARRGEVKGNPASFVRGERFAARAKEVKELPLKAFSHWQAFSQQLRKRGDLLAYYDFQRDPGNQRDRGGYELLRNRAATGSKFDGRLVGAVKMGMVPGRFRGKDALHFTYSGDGVRLTIPGKFPQFTLMASISHERCNDLSSILMTDEWDHPGPFHWQFVDTSGIKLSFLKPDSEFKTDAPEAADFAKWHLWATVYDAPGGRAAMYVDGRLLKEWKLADGPIATLGAATIGNWKPLENWLARPLIGSIDELAIFTSALGDADIKQLQEGESGDPQK